MGTTKTATTMVTTIQKTTMKRNNKISTVMKMTTTKLT